MFKDLVITLPNMVTHDSYILVKGKNHIQGTLDLQIRQVANMAKPAEVQLSTQTDTVIFHQGHQGCYTGNTCAHKYDSSDKLKIKNNTHKTTDNPNLHLLVNRNAPRTHQCLSASGH